MTTRPKRLSPQMRGQALSWLEVQQQQVESLACALDDAEPRVAMLLHDAASTMMTASWALVRSRLGQAERDRIDVVGELL